MSKIQEAILVSLLVLGLWAYGMYAFQDVIGSYDKYVALAGYIFAFLVFLVVWREKQTEETSSQEME